MRDHAGIRQLRGLAAALRASVAGKLERHWPPRGPRALGELEGEACQVRDQLQHACACHAPGVHEAEAWRIHRLGAINARPSPTEGRQRCDERARLWEPLAVLQRDELLVHHVPLHPKHTAQFLRDLVAEAGDPGAFICEARAFPARDVPELGTPQAKLATKLPHTLDQLLLGPLHGQVPPIQGAVVVLGGRRAELGAQLSGGLLRKCGQRCALRFLGEMPHALGRGDAPAQLEEARVIGCSCRRALRGVAASARFRAVGGRRRGGRGKSGEEP
mmetsp:Transcript_90922/g.177982  ORF Transcript_90922/g.177982 Transcript_90922/m.177982 type:complete len:274 (-) Transcript_90922:138-959(-)